MVSSALTTARQYKLGVLPLRKLLDEMTNSQGKKPVETVEDAVMELVEHACGSEASSIEKESSSKAAIAEGDSKDHSTVHEPEVRDTRDSDHDHDPVDSASGLPKAKALAMAAIEQAQAQVQEQERTTADNDTVSTLTILTQLVQKLNEDRQESRNREARLQKTIGEMNSEIKKMTTLVAAQAGAAEDREARLKKKIHNLECMVSQLSESITEIMTNQINAAKENNENHQKLARKLNDIKTPSNPRQGKPEMTRPTPEKTKNTNRETTDEKKERRKFSRPTSIKEYNPSRYSTNGRVHPKRDPPKFPSSRSSGKPMVIGCKKREIKNINGNYNPLARQNIGSETTAWNQPRSESCFLSPRNFPRMHSWAHWKVLCRTRNSRIKLSYPTNSPFWNTRSASVCCTDRRRESRNAVRKLLAGAHIHSTMDLSRRWGNSRTFWIRRPSPSCLELMASPPAMKAGRALVNDSLSQSIPLPASLQAPLTSSNLNPLAKPFSISPPQPTFKNHGSFKKI